MSVRVSIAMATYNGGKYLQEQLDSIQEQTLRPYELVICDDGSTDTTLSILERFSNQASFPVRIYRNEENLGYSDNFLKAAKLCKGDWVAFCDQDDVWMPNKLAAVGEVVNRHRNIIMVLQNAELCDGGLLPRGRLFPNRIKPGIYGANAQYGFWVWLGFLQTVKADMFSSLSATCRPPNYFPGHTVQSHDKWTCMVANALGGICVLGGPAAFYRRHDAALTGDYASKTICERVRQARTVDGDHYRFLAEVARTSSAYLHKVAEEVADDHWRDSFVRSAERFKRLADIQGCRAALYDTAGILTRTARYLRIWQRGGYVGPRFISMGIRSALKDTARLIAGSLFKAKDAL